MTNSVYIYFKSARTGVVGENVQIGSALDNAVSKKWRSSLKVKVFVSVWMRCKCGWQGRGDVGVVIVPLVVDFGGSVTSVLLYRASGIFSVLVLFL